jgi:hypothetical protein
MPRRYFEYILTARPWAHRGPGVRKRRLPKPKTYTVIARSLFEAELVLKNEHPRVTLLAWERGKPVEPPHRPA